MIHGITNWFFSRAHPRRQKVSSEGLLCGLGWPFAASTLLRFGGDFKKCPCLPLLVARRTDLRTASGCGGAGAHLFQPGPHLSGGQPYQGAERGIILA